MSAMANPPIISDHNRNYGNELRGETCVELPGIQVQRCADLQVRENYDVKGTYQFTEIEINYWFIRFLPDGGQRQGWRQTTCQTGIDAIKAHPNHVSLDATLHPNGPECSSQGMIEECDALWQCEFRPWGFSDVTVVTGEWTDPINTSKAVVNRTGNYYDFWTGMFHRTVTHCNENWGDTMASGGFSIGPRYFPFEGMDVPGWSHYSLWSCNNNFKGE
jgi:hypothetical protein